MKIDQDYFADANKEVDDLAIYFPLLQLSGPDRIMFLDEYNLKLRTKSIRKKEAFIMNKKPYEILRSLEAEAQKVNTKKQ